MLPQSTTNRCKGSSRVHGASQFAPDREVRHLRAGYPLDGLTLNRSQVRELQIELENIRAGRQGIPVCWSLAEAAGCTPGVGERLEYPRTR